MNEDLKIILKIIKWYLFIGTGFLAVWFVMGLSMAILASNVTYLKGSVYGSDPLAKSGVELSSGWCGRNAVSHGPLYNEGAEPLTIKKKTL